MGLQTRRTWELRDRARDALSIPSLPWAAA